MKNEFEGVLLRRGVKLAVIIAVGSILAYALAGLLYLFPYAIPAAVALVVLARHAWWQAGRRVGPSREEVTPAIALSNLAHSASMVEDVARR